MEPTRTIATLYIPHIHCVFPHITEHDHERISWYTMIEFCSSNSRGWSDTILSSSPLYKDIYSIHYTEGDKSVKWGEIE